MAKPRYTEAEFADALRANTSLAGVLKTLGLVPAGGNYANAKRTIQRLGLDASHLKGKAWNTDERLKDWSDCTRASRVKKHLLAERGSRCQACERDAWCGHPIPLEIHHADGDRTNNEVANLSLLCPNCHALTDGWRNRGAGGTRAQTGQR